MKNNILNSPKTTLIGLLPLALAAMDYIANILGLSAGLETALIAIITAVASGTLFLTTDDF